MKKTNYFILLAVFTVLIFSSTQAFALKIVSLKPNITQTLIQLGLGDQIVGVTKFCPKPNDKAQVVGDYLSVDAEKIMRLKPDMVLSSKENSNQSDYSVLQAAKIKIKYFSFNTWDELLDSIVQMGVMFKAQKKMTPLVKGMQGKVMELQKQLKACSGKTLNYTWVIQRRPLQVVGGASFYDSLLGQLGMMNTFMKSNKAYPHISEEILVREIVDYTFDSSPEATTEKEFLNKTVTPLTWDELPQSPDVVKGLEKLVGTICSDRK